MKFERRGRAQYFLGACSVLHAWQLHYDLVLALPLNDGFRHTQFIDTITQSGDVLLDRPFTYGFLLGLVQVQLEHITHGIERELVVFLGQHCACTRHFGGIHEPDRQTARAPLNTQVMDVFSTQQASDVGFITGDGLRQCGLLIHFHQEMHAAAQIQPQGHGPGADGAQPSRRARRQIQGYDVILPELASQQIARLELRLRIGEADQQTLLLAGHAAVTQILLLEHLFDAALQLVRQARRVQM